MRRMVLQMHSSMDSLFEEDYIDAATRRQHQQHQQHQQQHTETEDEEEEPDGGEEDDEEDEEEMLPEARMWRSVMDPASGKLYYYHIATRESQWEKPLVLCSAREREEVVRRGEQERYFFAEMEGNIRRKIQEGLLFADASGAGAQAASAVAVAGGGGSTAKAARSREPGASSDKSNAERPREQRPPDRLCRTISTVDEHRVVAELCASSPLPCTEYYSAIEAAAHDDFAAPPGYFQVNSGGSSDSPSGGGGEGGEGGGGSPPSLAPLAPVWTTSCPAVIRRLDDNDTFAAASSESPAAAAAASQIGNPSAAGELAGERVRSRERGLSELGTAEARSGSVHRGGYTGARPLQHQHQHFPPHLVRRNSTSTVHIAANDTMSDPDLDATIRCVCAVLRAHMIEAVTTGQDHQQRRREEVGLTRQQAGTEKGVAASAASGGVGWTSMVVNRKSENRARDGAGSDVQWTLERVALFDDSPPLKQSSSGEYGAFEVAAAAAASGKGTTFVAVVPPLREITAYFRHLYHRARLKFDCIVVSLIYVERLMKETKGALRPLPCNWKSLVMSALLLSSKVWDDHSMWNRHFSELCPMFTLVRLNQLEVAVLELLRFNVKVLSSEYAKYYFHLRSMCVRGGLSMEHTTNYPFDMEDVQVLEDLSSKLEIAPGSQKQQHRSKKASPSHGVNNANLMAMGNYTAAAAAGTPQGGSKHTTDSSRASKR